MITAEKLLDNTSHMDWLSKSQKMLVEAMMEAYKELTLEEVKNNAPLHSVSPRIIDWKEMRNNFFNECTTETPREESGKKVNMAPHDLFEWFKREISEYVG